MIFRSHVSVYVTTNNQANYLYILFLRYIYILNIWYKSVNKRNWKSFQF
jgi:hypothetical protein